MRQRRAFQRLGIVILCGAMLQVIPSAPRAVAATSVTATKQPEQLTSAEDSSDEAAGAYAFGR